MQTVVRLDRLYHAAMRRKGDPLQVVDHEPWLPFRKELLIVRFRHLQTGTAHSWYVPISSWRDIHRRPWDRVVVGIGAARLPVAPTGMPLATRARHVGPWRHESMGP